MINCDFEIIDEVKRYLLICKNCKVEIRLPKTVNPYKQKRNCDKSEWLWGNNLAKFLKITGIKSQCFSCQQRQIILNKISLLIQKKLTKAVNWINDKL